MSEPVPERSPERASAATSEHERFDALFRRYQAPMQTIAFGIVRSQETAAEIVQDVFLRLWSARDTLELPDNARHYLARATRNRALDCAAREALHRKWESSPHDAEDIPHGRIAGHEGEGAWGALTPDDPRHALHLVIRESLAAMPARRRQVCQLRWQENLRPTEIAARLAINVKTVETQLARGMNDLRARASAARLQS